MYNLLLLSLDERNRLTNEQRGLFPVCTFILKGLVFDSRWTWKPRLWRWPSRTRSCRMKRRPYSRAAVSQFPGQPPPSLSTCRRVNDEMKCAHLSGLTCSLPSLHSHLSSLTCWLSPAHSHLSSLTCPASHVHSCLSSVESYSSLACRVSSVQPLSPVECHLSGITGSILACPL